MFVGAEQEAETTGVADDGRQSLTWAKRNSEWKEREPEWQLNKFGVARAFQVPFRLNRTRIICAYERTSCNTITEASAVNSSQ